MLLVTDRSKFSLWIALILLLLGGPLTLFFSRLKAPIGPHLSARDFQVTGISLGDDMDSVVRKLGMPKDKEQSHGYMNLCYFDKNLPKFEKSLPWNVVVKLSAPNGVVSVSGSRLSYRDWVIDNTASPEKVQQLFSGIGLKSLLRSGSAESIYSITAHLKDGVVDVTFGTKESQTEFCLTSSD